LKDSQTQTKSESHTKSYIQTRSIKKKISEQKEYCLNGVKVLDLTNVIAGPTIGAFFARMGADVLKIDPPKPYYAPDVSVIYGLATNIGKKSMLLDIFNPQGREILEALIKDYDMLIINCTHESLVRVKLTRQELCKLNPNIILVHFDAWGGAFEKGLYSNYIGYDDNVQAGIGIMSRFGGGLDHAEEHAHIGTIDVIAGVACAAIAVQALIMKETYNKVFTVRTSLASVGQYIQYPFMFRERISKIGTGITCRGEHPLYACYQTKDHWIIFACCLQETPEKWKEINSLFGNGINSYQDLQNIFINYSSVYLLDLCHNHNIGASILKTLEDVRNTNVVSKYDINGPTYQFLKHYNHPVGVLCMIAPIATRMKVCEQIPAPKYGSHTLTILQHYKFENALLVKAASCSWSRYYIPYTTPCDKCNKRGLKLIVLNCEHKFCLYCVHDCNDSCHLCKRPHATNTEELHFILDNWKNDYKNWRRGRQKGSVDMGKIFNPN
jgi:crotonobetainyl-CoA:carnitine CoA-transferase CaiB-like acyl-CoA transferase